MLCKIEIRVPWRGFRRRDTPMSDETPTQKFEAPGVEAEPKRRHRFTVIAAIGGALLLAVVVLLVILLTRGPANPTPTPTLSPSPTPSATTTPTATPPASPSPAPTPAQTSNPPQATGPEFSSFVAPAEESRCSKGGPDFTAPLPLVKVSWATTGAVEAWFVTGTSDAADSRFMQIPLAGSQDDFPYPVEFGCSADSVTYTITLVGPGGKHVSKRWTVTNTGEKL